MVTRVNGKTRTASESLGMNLFFYKLTFSSCDLRSSSTADGGDATSQARLDEVIQIISTRAQPVIIGAVGYSGGTSTLRFAIEHAAAWEVPTAMDNLAESINTLAGDSTVRASTITIAVNQDALLAS